MRSHYLTLVIALIVSACGSREVKREGDKKPVKFVSTEHVVSEKYMMDPKESGVVYKGWMQLVPGNAHVGYVNVSKGELLMENDQLVGGSIEVDMTTITDDRHESNNELVDHLKSADFFDVKKFPISTFTITKVAPVSKGNVNVTGNLTIKGVAKAVTLPVKFALVSGVVNASAQVTIDRTKWDIRYNSGKFFDNLKDDAISDDIILDMKIVARK